MQQNTQATQAETKQATLKLHIDSAALRLKKAEIAQPYREARLIMAHILGWRLEELISATEIPAVDWTHFDSLIDRRTKHEPLSRLRGKREFYGRDFTISPQVLDPRPDSECLIDAILAHYGNTPPATLLDIGVGSGVLLLTLLLEWQGKAAKICGVGLDQGPDILAVARQNAVHFGIDHQCQFIRGNWSPTDSKEPEAKKFDLVMSNPPYIATGDIAALSPAVRDFDPIDALDGGEDGLQAYREIAKRLDSIVMPGGIIALEIGAGQQDAVISIFSHASCRLISQHRDLSGHVRALLFQPSSFMNKAAGILTAPD